ncbi:NAD(P)-binding protein [Thermoactinospora rubra]|uniref:NAD(P)-binding protein n=1 Tax=Thermoactinospora rubra TaxID=1088767 RepID=UPI001F0B36F7|nr:NAD(P)-binding protein [Thermoactinospora rubra]
MGTGSRDLGMDRRISRRDFLDGVARAAGTAALAAGSEALPDAAPEFMGGGSPAPPSGLRGDTPDALAVPHALRDGRFWRLAGDPEPTGEHYDLVVVGGGISGVAAAFHWLEHDPGARILILDNHDEIGGHARRNEFHPRGRPAPLVACGGSRWMRAVSAWTPEGRDLLGRLGVEPAALGRSLDRGLYAGHGMAEGVMCDRESFAADRLVRLTPGLEWLAELPVAEPARKDLAMLYGRPPDWFPGLSPKEKEARLAGLTYSQFLLRVCRVHPDAERFLRTSSSAEWGYDTTVFGAIDAWGRGLPGFQGLGLDAGRPSRYNSPTVRKEWGAHGAEDVLFPEGNQALVRMMLGRMIPGFAGDASMAGVTTAAYDHDRLDVLGNRVRYRLSSPVVSVANDGDPGTAATATVGYFDGHAVRTVRAGSVIMACWNMVVPHLVADLPAGQKDALRRAVKIPLLSATVQLRTWEAWRRLGVHRVRWTGAYWCVSELDRPVRMPGYACPEDPAEPIVVHMVAAPCAPGMPPAEGAAAGRRALLSTPYSHLEHTIRDQLARLLGPGGFDPARDIEAVAVNRWGHGYAPEYCRPWNTFYPDGPLPADLARRRFGRIAIANSDSVPAASADAAITAAYRAVGELLAGEAASQSSNFPGKHPLPPNA